MGLLAFLGLDSSATELQVGSKIPAVTQLNESGQPVDLGTLRRTVLVYFYPKADTPGCTKQACSLRDAYSELTEKGVQIFGVSHDSVESQKSFKQKYQLPFTLLADNDSKVATAFGVPSLMGFTKRQAYLFKEGTLVWRNLSAPTDKQAAEILAFLAK